MGGDGAINGPRISSPKAGWDWVAGVHEWQAKQLAGKKQHHNQSSQMLLGIQV